MQKSNATLIAMRVIAYVALFAALYFLFSQQATGAYPSDLPAHIKPPADDTYSALRIVYQLLIGAFDLPGICAFLALVEVATLGLTEYLIRKLAPTAKPAVAFICALACNFAIAIYLPFIHSYYTVGSPGGNCWHNSTYTVMRLLALAALVFYFKFDGRIEARSRVACWFGFTIFLTLATSVKPSFVMVFGPAVFALCVIDLKRQGATTVKTSLLVGLSLAIALLIVFYQLTILFPADGSEEGGIAFGLAKVWRARHANIFVSFVQSLAFPALVVFLTRFKFWEDRMFLIAWLMTFFAFAEYVFLYETGARTYHGNFGWGLSMAIFFLFIAAISIFLENRGPYLGLCVISTGEPPSASVKLKWLDYVTLLVFAYHTASGLWYFCRLMMGASFY